MRRAEKRIYDLLAESDFKSRTSFEVSANYRSNEFDFFISLDLKARIGAEVKGGFAPPEDGTRELKNPGGR